MKTIRYITISLFLAATLSSTGCYKATERGITLPLKYKTGLELTESRPDLIQSRLDSLIAYMIRNEILEIEFKKNNLRYEVVMRGMNYENEMKGLVFNKMLEDIELRNSTYYTIRRDHSPETGIGIRTSESGYNNENEELVISIKATVDYKDALINQN